MGDVAGREQGTAAGAVRGVAGPAGGEGDEPADAGEAAPAKFVLSNLPAGASLRGLVWAAKGRWWVVVAAAKRPS